MSNQETSSDQAARDYFRMEGIGRDISSDPFIRSGETTDMSDGALKDAKELMVRELANLYNNIERGSGKPSVIAIDGCLYEV